MRRLRFWQRWAVLGLAVLLAPFPAVSAQEQGTATVSPKPPANKATQPQTKQAAAATGEKEEPRDNRRDAIKVHGHWTIDIKNPDGTLVSHNEFDNALEVGAPYLAAFLTRRNTPGTWLLVLSGTPQPCGTECFIVDPTASLAGSGITGFPNLKTDVGGAQLGQIVLSGNATAAAAASIERVDSQIGACLSSVAPSSCNTPFGAPTGASFTSAVFSRRLLSTSIPVAAGQIIQVTVTFTFS